MNLHSDLTESTVENFAAETFAGLGFAVRRGAEIDAAGERKGPESALLAKRLANAIRKLNPAPPTESIVQVARTFERPPQPTLLENNRWLHGLLTDGVDVEYCDAATGENRGCRARLVDFDNPANNDFLVLARYGYPPDLSEVATQLVLKQSELSTANGES